MKTDADTTSMRLNVFRNTHLHAPKSLFTFVIKDEDFNRVLELPSSRPRSTSSRVLARALWFWPRIEDASGWVVSSSGTRWDPAIYLHSHRTKLIEQVLEYTSSSDALMELGCNCGSDMGNIVRFNGSIRVASVSKQRTWKPFSAAQIPETRPR